MFNDRPKVSVGMPIYNGERYLEEALQSLLGQTFDDFELVISDNASTDRTGEICRDYVGRDQRIRYVCLRRNFGVVENFNTVFRLSRGEYFKWAATDDVCSPGYLLRATEILDDDPSVVLAWARTVGIDEGGQQVPLANEVSDLNSPNSVFSPEPAVRFRRLLRNIWWVDGPFYGVMRAQALAGTRSLHPRHPSGDQILLAEMSLKGRFFEIDEETFFTRVHPGKTSRQHSTLRDRAGQVDQKGTSGGISAWWRLLRTYPARIGMYTSRIWESDLSLGEKALCQVEVARAVASWTTLRARQAVSGSSPWF